jgi:hypothetical protein
MDEHDASRPHANKTPEEWAQFGKRLFVRCLIVAIACGSIAAVEVGILRNGWFHFPGVNFFGPVFESLLALFIILAIAAGVSAIAALLGLYVWIGILLNLWIRNRNRR